MKLFHPRVHTDHCNTAPQRRFKFIGVAGVTSFNDLLPFDTASAPGSTVIHAGADAVTLVGFTGTLTAQDFAFA